MGINNQMAKTQIIFYLMDRMELAPIKQTDNNSPKVMNLSSTCFTDMQVRVLSKG